MAQNVLRTRVAFDIVPIELNFKCSFDPALDYRELAAAVGRSVGRHRRRNGKRCVHKLRDGPRAIDNANGLRWRRAQGFMDPAKIVMRDVQRDRRDVVV